MIDSTKREGMDLVAKSITGWLKGFIFLFGVYLVLHSHETPGGGFAGGKVLGESDARGEHPAKRPVHPVDLLWSIYELTGIDPAGKLPNPRGMDLTILPPDGGKNKISELYKNPESKP